MINTSQASLISIWLRAKESSYKKKKKTHRNRKKYPMIPVNITSPSKSVMIELMWLMRNGILKIISLVEPFWRISPSTYSETDPFDLWWIQITTFEKEPSKWSMQNDDFDTFNHSSKLLGSSTFDLESCTKFLKVEHVIKINDTLINIFTVRGENPR
jgi:hypothetical protein